MRFQLTIDGEDTILEPSQPFIDGEGVHHPCNVLTLWSEEELAAIGVTLVADAPPVLPTEVPMYKVRKLLIMQDMMGDVEAFLNGLPEPNRALALVDWDYAPNLVVSSPLAQGAKAALGLTDQQYEALVFAADAIA